MLGMRTTLTLDEDLASRLKDIAHERGIPFKQAVNETLRQGINGRKETVRFQQRTFSMGEPLVDITKAAQLADTFDDEKRVGGLEGP